MLHEIIQLSSNRSHGYRVKLPMDAIIGDFDGLPKSIIHLGRDMLQADKVHQQWVSRILLVLYQLPAALVQV